MVLFKSSFETTKRCKYEVYNFLSTQCIVNLGFLCWAFTVGVDQFEATQMSQMVEMSVFVSSAQAWDDLD